MMKKAKTDRAARAELIRTGVADAATGRPNLTRMVKTGIAVPNHNVRKTNKKGK